MDFITGRNNAVFSSTAERFKVPNEYKTLDPGHYDQSYDSIKNKVNDKKKGNSHIPYKKTLPVERKLVVPEIPEEEEEKEMIKNALIKPKTLY